MHHILHTLLDTLKIVPFLYLAFLLIEYLEHKLTKKNINLLSKTKKYGPLTGGLLGMIPQCGFSVLATNLYASRVITVGTLIAVYLSTSDEMLTILLSEGMPLLNVIAILLLKAGIAIIFGFIVDIFLKNRFNNDKNNDICHEIDCHCEENIFLASLKHTLNIALYIYIISLIIGLLVENIELSTVSNFFENNNLSYFLICLLGLIPNCASSIMITELYLNEVISFGVMMAGLLTANGVGILVLFKSNKHLKQNIIITIIIFTIGIISGFILDLLGICL